MWVVMAYGGYSRRWAIKSNLFGFEHTILMITHSLSFWILIDMYNEEATEVETKMYMMKFYKLFYLCGGIWSLEDIRITTFIKTPLFFVVTWKLLDNVLHGEPEHELNF